MFHRGIDSLRCRRGGVTVGKGDIRGEASCACVVVLCDSDPRTRAAVKTDTARRATCVVAHPMMSLSGVCVSRPRPVPSRPPGRRSRATSFITSTPAGGGYRPQTQRAHLIPSIAVGTPARCLIPSTTCRYRRKGGNPVVRRRRTSPIGPRPPFGCPPMGTPQPRDGQVARQRRHCLHECPCP